MALDKCNEAVGQAIGRELTKREKGIVSRRAYELQRKIEAAKNDPQAVDTVIKQFADDVEMNKALIKRTSALNYRAFAGVRAWRQATDFAVKNPSEAFKGLLRGSLFNYAGAKDSLASLVMRESNARAGALLADMEGKNLTDYAFAGTDDKNIIRAWYDIRNDVTPDPAKYGKNAVAMAEILEKHVEAMRVDHNDAGAFIARNADRLFKRTHDPNKIAKAGDNTWGSDESRDAWGKWINDHMDWDKAFDGDLKDATDQERLDALKQTWSNFTSETHLKVGETPPPTGLGSRNYGKKLSYRRDIVFKSPDDDLDYQRQFGVGNSVTENVWHNLAGGGRDLAMMRKLGPNPQATMDKIVADWKDSLRKAPPKVRDKFNKTVDDEMANTWRLLTESTGHPADNFVGQFFNAMNSTINTAAMGMSAFALPGDLALRASDMAQMTGQGVAKSLANELGRMVAGSGLSKAEQASLFAENGIRFEGAHLPLDPNMVDHVGFGAIAKWNRMVMRLTPHALWDNRLRTNALVADGYRYWSLRDKGYGALDAPVRSVLSQFGIDEKGWDVLRKSAGTDLGNGQKAFQPIDIRSMPLENFKSMVADENPSDAQLSRARNTLFEQYRNLLGEKADRSVTAPSIANRASMGLGYRGVKGGTVQGELYRGFLQLKGWVFNYMNNHLGRELLGYNTEYRTVGQAIVDMVRVWDKEHFQPRALSGMARLIAAGVPIALATNAMRDVATGKTPEPLDSAHTWQRAFARQSLGLVSDFLLEDVRPDSSIWDRLGHLAGPTMGAGADVIDSMTKLDAQLNSTEGLTPDKLGADERNWFQMVYRRVPGTQLAWNKFAMDYMVLNNLSEMMNPGYQQRLMDNAAKRGQTYIFGAGPQTSQ